MILVDALEAHVLAARDNAPEVVPIVHEELDGDAARLPSDVAAAGSPLPPLGRREA